MTMPFAIALRTAAFAALYVAASWVGRLTIMDDTTLSLVWPAAGVGALWFATRNVRWPIMDMAAMAAASATVNAVTGAPLRLAALYAVVNVVQALVFVRLFARLRRDPHRPVLTNLADLRGFLLAAVAAASLGSALGAAGTSLLADPPPWSAVAVWLARNMTGIIMIGSAGLALLALGRTVTLTRWQIVERAAIVALSVIGYCTIFGNEMPLAFALMTLTLWAAMRCGLAFVTVHSGLVGTLAVVYTITGSGPLAHVDSHPGRALVVQAFVTMVGCVGMVVRLSLTERDEVTRRATEASRDACAQARTLSTILDSMREAVGVVDSQGRFVLRNAATTRVLGITNEREVIRDPSFYGLHHPDGTPLAPEEMPHLQALGGKEVRDMDLVVRNPAVPDGRVINVNTVLMPPGEDPEDRRAVIVFRDVTAERRHRDELAAFAGVVAHDLLNPLTTIDGWAEIVAESAEESPVGPEVGDGLNRIRRAAGRMRHLINDLLAYTTARDAELAPIDVRLRDLARDVVAARLDLAPSGAPAPRFDVGDLPDVHADPVLVRQLLDNIIGNAVKYVRPGVAPHVTVAGVPSPDGLVRVEITDNGIGIPLGQHEAVFGNFHRAHRGAGHGGTGLGLTICKRIVERHGGTIAATDNPAGQGTRITFTLPQTTTSTFPREPVTVP